MAARIALSLTLAEGVGSRRVCSSSLLRGSEFESTKNIAKKIGSTSINYHEDLMEHDWGSLAAET